MKIRVSQLKKLVREVLYKASAPKKYNLPDIEVDADDTQTAGNEAARTFKQQHGVAIDPFTISLDEVPGESEEANLPKYEFADLVEMIGDGLDYANGGSDNINPSEFEDVYAEVIRILDGHVDDVEPAHEILAALDAVNHAKDGISPGGISYGDCEFVIQQCDKLAEVLEKAFPDKAPGPLGWLDFVKSRA